MMFTEGTTPVASGAPQTMLPAVSGPEGSPGLRGLRHVAPYFQNNSAATLEEVVDHYIEFFKRVEANAPLDPVTHNKIPPPVATTDGINFDRRPTAAERDALLAYLRKL
jgi:hypothetical protein